MGYSCFYQQNQQVHVIKRLSKTRTVLYNRVNLNQLLGFVLWSGRESSSRLSWQ